MLYRIICACLLFLLSQCPCRCQSSLVYDWNLKDDGYILGLSAAGWTGARIIKKRADLATFDDIMYFRPENVWAIDRGAVDNYSPSAEKASDILLFGSLALPLISHIDKNVRNEGMAVAGMMVEAYLINDGITSLIKGTAKRYRPYSFDYHRLPEDRISSTSRQSFISGHTSAVATASFFTAQVMSDLYPDSDLLPWVKGAAFALPAVTGYLRYRAGKHFPTDIIAGYGVGALVGTMIPRWHKHNKSLKMQPVPVSGGAVLNVSLGLN